MNSSYVDRSGQVAVPVTHITFMDNWAQAIITQYNYYVVGYSIVLCLAMGRTKRCQGKWVTFMKIQLVNLNGKHRLQLFIDDVNVILCERCTDEQGLG